MKNIFIVVFILLSLVSKSQGFSDEKVSLINFLKRQYNSQPYEGVKIVDDYNRQYLISVIILDKNKYSNESTMNRVAQVKAQSQTNTYINGATIDMNTIITTKETVDSTQNKTTIVETVESIKENSQGFSQGLELLTNFENQEKTKMIFIFSRELKKE